MRGVIVNNKIKPEKYRKLSITALVTGILVYGLGGPSFILEPVSPILNSIFSWVTPWLSIAAIVCGSIDLRRIKAGRYSNKGRGFDITGIVLGGIYFLFMLVFLLLEVAGPLSH